MRKDIPNETRMLCESVTKFMNKEIVPVIDALDHYPVCREPQGFFDSLSSRLGELGLFSLMVPQELGGSGQGLDVLSAVVEAMARIYASVPSIVLAHSIGQMMLLEKGTPEQKERWLRVDETLGRPPVLSFPMYLEPEGPGFLEVEEQSPEGDLTVGGTCELVVNGPIADGLVLPVRGRDGIVMVVVPRELKGLTLSEPVLTIGLRASPAADVSLQGVQVLREGILGNGAVVSLAEVYPLFYGPIAALCAGICCASLERAVSYVKERSQGGRPLAEYSHVQMMVSAIVRSLETARLAAGTLSESGARPDPEDIALFVSARDGVARAMQDGVQLLGGYGYMEDYGQERCMRDAKQAHMMLGRDDLRRLELAGLRLRS